ncbi:hypothetical protein [Sinorhizobium glycinis]|uniref:hypothetical protein n=1 Tax=Sinorhizobium glycinis TaxID=1472378 RepID=UPI000AADE576
MSAALDAMPSMIERIRHDLVGLKMPRALEALDHVVRRLEHGELSALEAIDILLSEELTLRENSRIKTALRMGRLATITIRHPKSPALAENHLAESSMFTNTRNQWDVSGAYARFYPAVGLFASSRAKRSLISRGNQLDVTNTQGLSQLIKSNHGRVASPALKAAQILLAETGTSFDLFLCQALLPTQAGEIRADQLAHIHALKDRRLHTISLSTKVCKRGGSERPSARSSCLNVEFRFNCLASSPENLAVAARPIQCRPWVLGSEEIKSGRSG